MDLIHLPVKKNSVILDKSIAKKVASCLLSVSAVQLNVANPFTWVSGIKAPVYCDNRKINSYVKQRRLIAQAFVDIIQKHYSNVEVIAGVATGGIPMGILVAERMDLPFIYVRQTPKVHGLKRQIEGHYRVSQKVILIEDHVSTGGSSLKALNGLINAGLDVMALISIMTYNFKKAIDLFNDHHIKHVSLSDLDTILGQALEENLITFEQSESILNFRDDPAGWHN